MMTERADTPLAEAAFRKAYPIGNSGAQHGAFMKGWQARGLATIREAEAAADSLRSVGPAAAEPPDAVWAHVVREPETHEPALLDDEALASVNEAMHDVTAGYFLDRSWIQPGPLLDRDRAAQPPRGSQPDPVLQRTRDHIAGMTLAREAVAPQYRAGIDRLIASARQSENRQAGGSLTATEPPDLTHKAWHEGYEEGLRDGSPRGVTPALDVLRREVEAVCDAYGDKGWAKSAMVRRLRRALWQADELVNRARLGSPEDSQ